MIALLDVKHKGEHFVAALHFKPDRSGTEITEIASFYPRQVGKIMSAVERTIDGRKGAITYYHKKRTRDWLSISSGSNSNGTNLTGFWDFGEWLAPRHAGDRF
jgi:hypothetical protein